MNQAILSITSLLIFATPFIFWTLTPNIFSTPKEIIITLSTLIIMGLTITRTIKSKNLSLPRPSLMIPLVIFTLSLLGSLYANPEGRPEALGGKASTLLSLTLLAIILIPTMTTNFVNKITNLIITSGTLLAIHSLLSLTFLFRSPYLPGYMQTIGFTPTGSYITTLVFIIISSTLILSHLKQASKQQKYFYLPTLIINTIAIVAIASLMLPGQALAYSQLPLAASWSIALDALKSLRSLFFGIGVSNYSLLYTSVKPLSLNTTDLWNTLPQSASSELLTLLPTAGIIATLSLLYLMLQSLVRSYSTPLFAATLIIAISLIFLPGSIPLYLLFFTLYTISSRDNSTSLKLAQPYHILVSIALSLLSITLAFSPLRSALSETMMRRAQVSLDGGDSQKVYELHLQLLRVSPKVTNYHLSFADVNFRLASALSQKESLSDTDRETISNLVQQSIQSAKAAITLRPNDPRTWLTTAKIYQSLINVADGAENFALEAFARAISLDRANPNLRLEYGNLLTQIADTKNNASESSLLKNRAASEIQVAIQLKPDFANAYYNLALLLNSVSNKDGAIRALEQTLKLLDESSQEYARVQNELENLKSQKPSTSPSPTPITSPSSTLTTPSPLPSPLDGGPINLSE